MNRTTRNSEIRVGILLAQRHAGLAHNYLGNLDKRRTLEALSLGSQIRRLAFIRTQETYLRKALKWKYGDRWKASVTRKATQKQQQKAVSENITHLLLDALIKRVSV